jgi:hypothetical protein
MNKNDFRRLVKKIASARGVGAYSSRVLDAVYAMDAMYLTLSSAERCVEIFAAHERFLAEGRDSSGAVYNPAIHAKRYGFKVAA